MLDSATVAIVDVEVVDMISGALDTTRNGHSLPFGVASTGPRLVENCGVFGSGLALRGETIDSSKILS